MPIKKQLIQDPSCPDCDVPCDVVDENEMPWPRLSGDRIQIPRPHGIVTPAGDDYPFDTESPANYQVGVRYEDGTTPVFDQATGEWVLPLIPPPVEPIDWCVQPHFRPIGSARHDVPPLPDGSSYGAFGGPVFPAGDYFGSPDPADQSGLNHFPLWTIGTTQEITFTNQWDCDMGVIAFFNGEVTVRLPEDPDQSRAGGIRVVAMVNGNRLVSSRGNMPVNIGNGSSIMGVSVTAHANGVGGPTLPYDEGELEPFFVIPAGATVTLGARFTADYRNTVPLASVHSATSAVRYWGFPWDASNFTGSAS